MEALLLWEFFLDLSMKLNLGFWALSLLSVVTHKIIKSFSAISNVTLALRTARWTSAPTRPTPLIMEWELFFLSMHVTVWPFGTGNSYSVDWERLTAKLPRDHTKQLRIERAHLALSPLLPLLLFLGPNSSLISARCREYLEQWSCPLDSVQVQKLLFQNSFGRNSTRAQKPTFRQGEGWWLSKRHDTCGQTAASPWEATADFYLRSKKGEKSQKQVVADDGKNLQL